MEDRILGEDLPLPPARLFERLAQIPNFTWDQTSTPFHSTYDHWHVSGILHNVDSETTANATTMSTAHTTRSSGSTKGSPKLNGRPNFRQHWSSVSGISTSSEISSSRADPERLWTPVVARISTHVLRLEREFNYFKMIVDNCDPHFEHSLHPIVHFRLPSTSGDPNPMMVCVYEAVGPNYLTQIVNMGPAYFGGRSRPNPDHTPSEQISLPSFLDFAIGACECLELLHHGANTIHGEIRQDTFHWNRTTNRVKLLHSSNGGRAFDNLLSSEGWASLSKELGAKIKLSFVAPEHTGRLAADPDARTDVYSLGILFWTVLIGHGAFVGATPLEIIQKVLSSRLPLLTSKRMDIPDALSQVVAKMTHKQMAERYHSISGLKHDLTRIQKLLGEGEQAKLSSFTIAQKDVSSFFTLPSTLVGRDEECSKIHKIVDKAHKRTVSSAHKTMQSVYSAPSVSSISDNGFTGPDIMDGSDSSSSIGVRDSRSNSTAMAHESLHKFNRANMMNIGRMIADNRNMPMDASDRDSSISAGHSMNISDGLGHMGRRRNSLKFKRRGKTDIVLLAGSQGVGKTALLKHVQPYARRHGYLAAGAFDRARPNPFEQLLKVIGSLFRQIFSEKDISTPYHEMIRAHVRPIWASLHELLNLPENMLDLNVPNQGMSAPSRAYTPSVKTEFASIEPRSINNASTNTRDGNDFLRGPASTKTIRLINTIMDVLRIICTGKLICICLDDIHAADEESVDLTIHIAKAKIPLVMLLACRPLDSKEVSDKLKIFFKHETIHLVEVGNLQEQHTFEYVAATMSQQIETVLPLAAVIHEKSRGNSFMMREVLQVCYRKECVWYDWRISAWQFDLDKVFNELSTEGNLDTSYLTRKLSNLSPASRSILAWASLIGESFCFKLVQRILSGDFFWTELKAEKCESDDAACADRAKRYNISEADSIEGLQQLLSLGILVANDSDYEFKFSHTRYLRAAKQMRECQNLKKMHFVLAQAILSDFCHNQETLYSLTRHICISAEVFKNRVRDRARVRNILWNAAQTAAETGASATALWYYQTCMDLLQPEKWDESQPDVFYDETLQVYVNTAELLVQKGDYDDALSLLNETFEHARCAADKTRSYLLTGKILTAQGKYTEAYNPLRKCLLDLGVHLPHATWDECNIEFQKLEYRIRNLDREELLTKPLSEDRATIALGTVFSEVLATVYWADILLWYQIVTAYVNTILDRGMFIQVGIGFNSLGVAAVAIHKDLELGSLFSDIALAFFELYDDVWTRGRGWTLYSIFLSHLYVPIRNVLPILDNALEYALRSGERDVSIINLGAMASFRFWAGQDVLDVESFCSYAPDEFDGWEGDVKGGTSLMAIRQLTRALQGKTGVDEPATILDDDDHTQAGWLQLCDKNPTVAVRSRDLYRGLTIPIYFVYGYYEYLVDFGRIMVSTTLDDLGTSRPVAQVRFYLALALCQLARTRVGVERDALILEAKHLKKFIDNWGAVNDVNYKAWCHLLASEIAELVEDFCGAMTHSEIAIDHCSVHGFAFEEAIAVELQAENLLARGAKRAAKTMMQEAVSAWNRFGAVGKAKQLSQKHEWLLKTAVTSRTMDTGVQTMEISAVVNHDDPGLHVQPGYTKQWLQPNTLSPINTTTDMPGLGLDVLDLTSILEFSRVISSELQINALLEKMTGVILESVGGQAEFCAVVTNMEDQGWSVAASADQENGVKTYPDGVPFTEVDDQVAQHITNYIIRTKEAIFIPNVLEDERFLNVSEAYLERNPTGRAIICLPVLQMDHLMGVIHIEGRPNAFTQRNMIVLNLLTNQVSISLGNALLYRKVRKVSAANAAMVESQKRALAAAREAEAKAKSAEAEAKHNVKLKEEAAKAKSIFLANVSHELRTPLNGVIGMSELLKGTSLSKDQESYADSIRVCADTLLTVINDILDFSKLEAGKMQMFTVAINLKETISEVVRALAYTNREHDLETIEKLDLEDNLVLGDPVRLHQIFMNLLSNAYKFTPSGSVTVRADRIAETKDKIKVMCSVEDTGIGITEEQLTRLFQPFSQADSSTARSYGGSGLGLSICKAMIENVLGGKIWIESKADVGTKVSFTLTFQKAPEHSSVQQDMKISAKDPDPMSTWSQGASPLEEAGNPIALDLSKIPRSEIRVCIAEDNNINRKIAMSYVSKLGFKGEAYEDGKQAWQALQRRSKEGNPFHIVLMDVQMPVLDGYEATKAIRADEDERVKEVLIIAMTASAIRGDREKCLEAGMNDYLAKPVRQAALKNMLDEYINNTKAAALAARKSLDNGKVSSDAPNRASLSKANGNNDDKVNGEISRKNGMEETATDAKNNRSSKGLADRSQSNGNIRDRTTTPGIPKEPNDPPSGKLIADANGHFSSDHIPPKSQLQRAESAKNSSWRNDEKISTNDDDE